MSSPLPIESLDRLTPRIRSQDYMARGDLLQFLQHPFDLRAGFMALKLDKEKVLIFGFGHGK